MGLDYVDLYQPARQDLAIPVEDIMQFFPEGLNFYPKHPSDEKTRRIQTSPSPMLEGQEAPFDAKELCNQFVEDLYGSLEIYEDKRFDVTGVAVMVGRDIYVQKNVIYHSFRWAFRMMENM